MQISIGKTAIVSRHKMSRIMSSSRKPGGRKPCNFNYPQGWGHCAPAGFCPRAELKARKEIFIIFRNADWLARRRRKLGRRSQHYYTLTTWRLFLGDPVSGQLWKRLKRSTDMERVRFPCEAIKKSARNRFVPLFGLELVQGSPETAPLGILGRAAFQVFFCYISLKYSVGWNVEARNVPLKS